MRIVLVWTILFFCVGVNCGLCAFQDGVNQAPDTSTTAQDPDLSDISVESAEKLRLLAEADLEERRLLEAYEKLRKALNIYNQATDFRGPEKTKYLIPIGDFHQYKRDHESAIQVYKWSIEFELLGLYEETFIEKGLDRLAIAIASKFKPIYALAQWSDLISKAYLNVNHAILNSDFPKAHRIAARIAFLTRDLVGMADPKEALHVQNAFSYASRAKSLKHRLIEAASFRADDGNQIEIDALVARYLEVENELLRMDIVSATEGREFAESRTQVKLGLLEEIGKQVPIGIQELTTANRQKDVLDGLNEKLPVNTALIEIARATTTSDQSKNDFVAFIANKNQDNELIISMVWLEESNTIIEIASNWRNQLLGQNDDAHALAQCGLDMREVFWRPISKYIGESNNIILCATDNLADISWEEIPGIQTPDPGTPAYVWSLAILTGFLFLICLFRRSSKFFIASLMLLGITMYIWYYTETGIAKTDVLGNQYQFTHHLNAYDYLHSFDEKPE